MGMNVSSKDSISYIILLLVVFLFMILQQKLDISLFLLHSNKYISQLIVNVLFGFIFIV